MKISSDNMWVVIVQFGSFIRCDCGKNLTARLKNFDIKLWILIKVRWFRKFSTKTEWFAIKRYISLKLASPVASMMSFQASRSSEDPFKAYICNNFKLSLQKVFKISILSPISYIFTFSLCILILSCDISKKG